MVVIHLGVILAMGTSPSIRPSIGEVQRGIAPQLGNEVQAALARHRQGVVVAEVAIQHEVGHREDGGAQVEQGRQHGLDAHQFRGECGPCFRGVLAALRTSRTTWGLDPVGQLGRRFSLARSLFRVAADDLLDAHRKRPPLLDAHQGEREEGQPWHRLAVQAGEEPIEALGVLAGFRDDDVITSNAVDIRRAEQMVPKEHPKQHRPGEDGGEQALHGAIAPAFAGPAGEAQHGNASRHHQQGQGDPTQAVVGCRRDMGSETVQQ